MKNEDIIHSIYFKRNESSVVACTRTLGALFDTLVYCSIGLTAKAGRQANERTSPYYIHTVYLAFFGVTVAVLVNCERKSMGTGKIIVEFFSAAMELRV